MALLITHVPPTPLRPLVITAIGYRTDPIPSGIHRVMPTSNLLVIVELGDRLEVQSLGQALVVQGLVGGLQIAPGFVGASHALEGLRYELCPLHVHRLLGMGSAVLRDQTLELTDVFGAAGARLVDRLHATPTWEDRFRLFDEMLIQRLPDRSASIRSEVGRAWQRIVDGGGRRPIFEIAADVGWGRRHLTEQFHREIGLTPKEAARIARFEVALRRLRRPGHGRLADLAVECGLADQSHLAREWHALTDCTLGAWLREELPYLQDQASLTGAGPRS